MLWTQQKTVVAGFGLAVTLLVGAGVVSYRNTLQLIEASERVAHTHEVLAGLERILADLISAETGERGYILTGDEQFLEPYHSGVSETFRHIHHVRELTADNARQQNRLAALEPMAQSRLALLDQGIRSRREEVFEAARELILSGQGKVQMDAIRAVIAEMEAEENRLLEHRSQKLRADTRTAMGAAVLGALLALGVLVFVFLLLSREITARKRAEQEQSQLAAIVESTDDAITGKTLDGIIVSWNPGAERLYGYSALEAKGSPISILVPPDRPREVPEILERIKRGERAEHFESARVRKDGRRIEVSLSISPVMDSQGRITGASTIARDITKRRQAEEKIRELNAQVARSLAESEALNKELEAFAYSVSHDLRAPLRAIDGFSLVLLEDYEQQLDDEGKDHLRRVRGASQRMGQLIDDMLALSRVTRREMRREKVDLSALAASIGEELRQREPHRQVDFSVADGAVVEGDPQLLHIALENLLDNAWKYTGKKTRARIEFGIGEDGGRPLFFVRDDGVGFDMRYVHKLFGAFQRLHPRTDFEGTGVGLATVQRIIRRHGGRVWAEAAVNQGATFYFTLRAEEETNGKANDPSGGRQSG